MLQSDLMKSDLMKNDKTQTQYQIPLLQDNLNMNFDIVTGHILKVHSRLPSQRRLECKSYPCSNCTYRFHHWKVSSSLLQLTTWTPTQVPPKANASWNFSYSLIPFVGKILQAFIWQRHTGKSCLRQQWIHDKPFLLFPKELLNKPTHDSFATQWRVC